MSQTVRLLHNPRCSKSSRARQILDEQDIEVEIIDYLKQPPSVEELADILAMLGMQPRELMRKHEEPYQRLQLDDETLSASDLLQAMADNPILIQRPIVIHGRRAVIGRPPEKILEII